MKELKYLFCLAFLVIAVKGKAQCNVEQDTLAICYNGSFEISLPDIYSFTNDVSFPENSFSCAFDTSVLTGYNTAIDLNDFSDPITLVDDSGYEPNLATLGINMERVAVGHKAIKLNDNIANLQITTMTKSFIVTDTIVSFKFLLVAQNPTLDSGRLPPCLRARVYNSDRSLIIDEYCLTVDENNAIFNSAGTGSDELLYTEWICEELIIIPELEIDDEAQLEIMMTDNGKGLFATVYIDDICDGCCPECPELYGTVPDGDSDYRQASMCINAYNTIEDGAESIYHAGYEVLLLPCFTALEGSDDHYYIEGCTDNFEARYGRPQNPNDDAIRDSGLNIYPNPVNNKLYIEPQGMKINNLSLYSLDGKLIIKEKPEITGSGYQVDTGRLSNGIYILTLETDDGRVRLHKIVKN